MANKETTLDLRAMATTAFADVSEAKKPTLVPANNSERVQLTPRVISFKIAYDAPDGKDYSADLESKVLDSDGRMAKMRVSAQLTRGLDLDHLSQEDLYRIDSLSRLAVQLVEPPKWLVEFAGMDLDLLIQINNILLEHETRYFRGNSRKGEGEALEERVRVSVPAFDAPTVGQ